MINKRLKDLDSVNDVSGTNYLLVDDSTFVTSKKSSIDTLKTYILSGSSYGTSGSSGINGTSGSSGSSGTSGSGILPIIGNTTELLFRDDNTASKYNTSSGLTYSANTLKIYGSDTSDIQKNAFIADGLVNGDKGFIVADNNVNKWGLKVNKYEGGKYLHLYNFENLNDNIILEETGRVGFNKASHVMNYHTDYVGIVGVGLNDVNIFGIYSGDTLYLYEISIRNTGVTTDTFRWRKSTNYGTNWGVYSTEKNISLTPTLIEYGITCYWSSLTGHSTSNAWQFYSFPEAPQGSFTIGPTMYNEIQKTLNYTVASPVFEDLTYELSTSTDKTSTPLASGSTSAFYVGVYTQFRAVYINLKTAGSGVTTIAKYWNGSTWSGLTITDGTSGFTISGSISFTKPLDWAKCIPSGMTDPFDNFYWIGIMSSTNIVTAPVVNSFARNGDKRLAVYSAPMDPVPMFSVSSNGNIMIGNNYDIVKSKLTVGTTNGLSSKLVCISDVLNPTSQAGGNGVAINFGGGGGIYMKDNSNNCEGKYEAFNSSIQVGAMSGHPLGLYSTNLLRMYFNNAGSGSKFSAALGTGVNTFDSVNPELFKLGDSGYTTVSYNLLAGYANLNNYLQLNIRNFSSGFTSSSDIVATANNGNESSNYIDMGINGSNFSDTGFTIYKANDAYLYNIGQDLNIGTGTNGKIIKFHTGGFSSGNTIMTIDSNGISVTGTIISSSSIKISYDSSTASSSNVGSLRYRSDSNNSYCEMCMQVGTSTYEWVEIKKNTWV